MIALKAPKDRQGIDKNKCVLEQHDKALEPS